MAAIIVWAKLDSNGFNTLWALLRLVQPDLCPCFAFVCISVWLFESGKSKFVWMPPDSPVPFYTFICSTFIANATIGFNLPWAIAYPIGAGADGCVCDCHCHLRQEARRPGLHL